MKKILKMSKRGITFSFDSKESEKFSIGSKYTYVYDVDQNNLVIFPSDNEGNTVSRKKAGSTVKSLIDIRNSKVLEQFKGSKYLVVTVEDEMIRVEGITELAESESDEHSKVSSKSQVVTMAQIKASKKSKSLLIPKAVLSKARKAAGFESQMSIFDYAVDTFVSSKSDRQTLHDEIQYPLDVISCFSGAGVLDLGFIKEGFNIIHAVELNPDAVKTYSRNIGNHVVQESVTDFPLAMVPKAKIIIGSPPCTPFSKERCNYSTTSVDEHKDSQLIKSFIEWVNSEYADYDIAVIENVPEIITSMQGLYIDYIKEKLPDYDITYGLVNDASVGGYQNRTRAIIIASKLGPIPIPEPTVPKEKWKTVGDALKKVNQFWPNQKDVSVPRDTTLERMKHVKPGGNWRDIPEYLRTKARHSNSYRRKLVCDVHYRKFNTIWSKAFK